MLGSQGARRAAGMLPFLYRKGGEDGPGANPPGPKHWAARCQAGHASHLSPREQRARQVSGLTLCIQFSPLSCRILALLNASSDHKEGAGHPCPSFSGSNELQGMGAVRPACLWVLALLHANHLETKQDSKHKSIQLS